MKKFLPHKKAALLAAFMFLGMLIAFPVNVYPQTKSKKLTNNYSYSFAKPDFAFPQTVEKGAEKRLSKAIDDKNGLESLRSVIQLVVARNLISATSFQSNVTLIDSVGKLMPAPYNSLFILLQADMYAKLYNTDRRKFNGRTLPVDTFPEDVMAWSGDLFARKVLELVDKALVNIDFAENMPLDELSPVLSKSKNLDYDGLTVADFMTSQGYDILYNFYSVASENVVPFRTDLENTLLSPKEKCLKRAVQLIESRIETDYKKGMLKALSYFLQIKTEYLSGEERKAFLSSWKDKLLDTPEDGMILALYFETVNNNKYTGSDDSKLLYSQMQKWLKNYPSSRYTKAVNYALSQLIEKRASIDIPDCIYPDSVGIGSVRVTNVNSLFTLIYKVPDSMIKNNDLVVKNFPGASQCVAVIPHKFEGTVPFSSEINFEIPALPSGNYVMIPSSTEKLSTDWKDKVNQWSLRICRVTNLSIIITRNSMMKDSGVVYVVDAMTQKPVEGATVICRDDDKILKTGTTDNEGAFNLPSGDFRICVSKDENNNQRWCYNNYNKPDESKTNQADIFTDLSIYHPGDTLQFTIVGWYTLKDKSCLNKNSKIKVNLLDANFNEVDSLMLTTDDWGRCDGEFKLPAQGMLGTYNLSAAYLDNQKLPVTFTSFEVADYKTPSFYVELQKDSTSTYLPGDIIKFKGNVKTYSGMPLTGVDVKYNVRWSPWWRFGGSSNSASYGGSLLTGENGEFVIELPTENLKGTQYEWGIYTLSVSATSSSGETQSAPGLRFSLGNELSIRPQIPDKIQITADSVRFNIPVYDMLNLPVSKEMVYRISSVSDPTKVIDGKFLSPVLSLQSSRFPSGEYNIELNLAGDTVKTSVKTVIFRTDDVKCPVETPLWVPENKIVVNSGQESVDVKVGSGWGDGYILCIVSENDSILSRKWFGPNNEIFDINIPLPTDFSRLRVTFSGMRNFRQVVENVDIVSKNLERKLDFRTSVFRDRVSTGDKEEWKFTFVSNFGDIQNGCPAFAVMSNKSLNAIAPFKWNFYPRISYGGGYAQISIDGVVRYSTSARFSKQMSGVWISNSYLGWNTYNHDLVDYPTPVMMTSRKLMGVSSVATSRSTEGDMVQEVEYKTSAPMMYKAEAVAANDMVALAEESVASSFDADAGASDVADDGVSDVSDMSAVELRPVEMPLAFFMPRLNADDNGEVTVAFDVPNYNTTWQFQLMGYNEEVMSANVVLDVVASKPVMVRGNPPRFVRTGDTMSVSATLFNNTDSTAAISGRIELFDPTNDKVILSKNFSADNVTPSGNRTVNVDFLVPDNLSTLGIRSYALTDTFSDGEQTVIPVLPSSTPVIESTQFYLKIGETDYSVKLPKFSKNANLTLKYCDNPIWECLLALPSIAEADSKNVFSVTRALFANSMSQNVVEKYPMVKESLAKVFAENDTAILTSNLQKEAELKTVTLNNTPWVNDAASETRRMRSLDKLLDKTAVDASVSSLLTDLKGLQNADGGWSWCPDMKTSYFITRSVLLQLGLMKRAGCLPADALTMAQKAISYCDAKAYDDYLKSDKKFSVYDMLSYLYARSFFDNGDGKTGFSGLKKKALKEISEEWKDFSVYGKAVAAILMSRSQGYEKTSRVILESLNQYASKDDAKGWWFDNLSSGFDGMPKLLTTATVLQAYNEIEPSTDAVEGLRQWLVLQKETENWGANSYTVEVISAIMGSGSDWTSSSEPATFLIDGKEINIEDRQMLTGMVTLNLDPSKVSGKTLKVTKHSDGPAWGGVVSQYVAPIKDVKADESANLKIEKQLLVVSDTSAGEVAKDGEIHVGDKVRVTLTLTCDKDMDYVAVIDERGAFLEPADQISGYDAVDNLFLYKEARDNKTSFFIDFLPKGVNVITYDCYADRKGTYSVGIASVQSQYSPLQAAHSAGKIVEVK